MLRAGDAAPAVRASLFLSLRCLSVSSVDLLHFPAAFLSLRLHCFSLLLSAVICCPLSSAALLLCECECELTRCCLQAAPASAVVGTGAGFEEERAKIEEQKKMMVKAMKKVKEEMKKVCARAMRLLAWLLCFVVVHFGVFGLSFLLCYHADEI